MDEKDACDSYQQRSDIENAVPCIIARDKNQEEPGGSDQLNCDYNLQRNTACTLDYIVLCIYMESRKYLYIWTYIEMCLPRGEEATSESQNIMLLQLTKQEKKQRFSQFKVVSSFYEDTVVIDSTM